MTNMNRIIQLVYDGKRTAFWKEVVEPQLQVRLAMLDGKMCSESDPWKRYGYVEAYKQMKEFTLWFDDILSRDSEDTDTPERIDTNQMGTL